MRSLTARVKRLERKAPAALPVQSSDRQTQWLFAHYPALMRRWAALVDSVGEQAALRELTDDELEQLIAALTAAAESLETSQPTK